VYTSHSIGCGANVELYIYIYIYIYINSDKILHGGRTSFLIFHAPQVPSYSSQLGK
jgi:hypothetical protein